jgi:hypothetical protein
VGAPKQQTVGGGRATGVANSFNDFLLNGLKSGQFGGSQPQQPTNNFREIAQGGGPFAGIAGQLGNIPQPTALGPNPQEGPNQTNMFGNTINSLLGGQIGDPTSYQQFFQGMQGNGGMNLNIPQNFNYSQSLPTNFDTPEAAAIQQIIGRNMDKDVASLRARFGSGGGTSYGTGAAFAEGNLRAEANPQIAAALSQVNRQEREMDMANRGMVGNLALQNQQNQNQFGLGQAGIGLGMQGNQLSAQQGILDQLFRSFGQANQLGTAQRETVMSPSTGSQIFNGVMGLGGAALGAMGGNPFGSLGGLGGLFGGGGGGQQGLGGSTPFMNNNQGLFGGQNFGMGGGRMVNPSNPFMGGGLQGMIPNFGIPQGFPQQGLQFPRFGY